MSGDRFTDGRFDRNSENNPAKRMADNEAKYDRVRTFLMKVISEMDCGERYGIDWEFFSIDDLRSKNFPVDELLRKVEDEFQAWGACSNLWWDLVNDLDDLADEISSRI